MNPSRIRKLDVSGIMASTVAGSAQQAVAEIIQHIEAMTV